MTLAGSLELARMLARRAVTQPMVTAGNQFRGDYLLQQSTGHGRDSLAKEPGAMSSPLHVVAAAKRVRMVRAALGVTHMRLLVGVVVEDRSPAEVARELGVDPEWGAPSLRLALGDVVRVYGVVEVV